MNVSVIGSGNIGSTLALRLRALGHHVLVGARKPFSEKTQTLGMQLGMDRILPIEDAVAQSTIIIIATPAPQAIAVAQSLGDTTGKIIIDTMNTVRGNGAPGFGNTSDALLAHTQTQHVVKCFNTTGFENLQNPIYPDGAIDMFMAGDSLEGKEAARELALQLGFAACWDMGGNDRFSLMEQMAMCWINLAIIQGQGRNMAFRLVKRE
jgi:predicted dinucleotide-binding enzyme